MYLGISCVKYSLNEKNVWSTVQQTFSLFTVGSRQLLKGYKQ